MEGDLGGAHQHGATFAVEVLPIRGHECPQNFLTELGVHGRAFLRAMRRADAADAGEAEQGFHPGGRILFGECAVGPLRARDVFDGGARGPADEAVGMAQVRPGDGECLWIGFTMQGFQSMTEITRRTGGRLCGDEGGGLRAGVGDAIEAGLHAATADREIHRAVAGVDDGIRERQGSAREKFFAHGLVGRAVGFEVHGVELAPAPIEDEECVLVTGGKFRAVAEGGAGG